MEKIVVIKGSPRRNGNTELLANAFIEGAEAAGNEVEEISVTEKNIQGCLGCNYCYNEPNKCIQKDDMAEIYEILRSADVIVFATPIYFYGVSAQLKMLIDRLHNPIRSTFSVKKLALLAVCADTNEITFHPVKMMYQSVLNYFSLQDGGIVTAVGMEEKGDIIGNPVLDRARKLGRRI